MGKTKEDQDRLSDAEVPVIGLQEANVSIRKIRKRGPPDQSGEWMDWPQNDIEPLFRCELVRDGGAEKDADRNEPADAKDEELSIETVISVSGLL